MSYKRNLWYKKQSNDFMLSLDINLFLVLSSVKYELSVSSTSLRIRCKRKEMTGHHSKGKYSTWHQCENEKQDIQTHTFSDEETASKQWTDWLPRTHAHSLILLWFWKDFGWPVSQIQGTSYDSYERLVPCKSICIRSLTQYM